MKKAILFPILVLTLALCLALPMAVGAHTEADPFVTDLIADGGDPSTEIDAGDLLVWNDEENLYVKYSANVSEGWYIVETHLHVASAASVVPQKNGNPSPGKFDYKTEHDPAVEDYTYTIPLGDLEVGDDVVIAAHAEVIQVKTISFVTDYGFTGVDNTTGFSTSDSTNNLGKSGLSLLDGFGQVTASADLSHRGTRGLGVSGGEPDEIDGSENITITFDEPVYLMSYELRSLFVIDQPEVEYAEVLIYNGATLVATDNVAGVEALGSGDGDVIVDRTDSPILADKLVFQVNEAYRALQNEYAVAALTVQVDEETAWGDGADFSGRNWAMYVCYTIQ